MFLINSALANVQAIQSSMIRVMVPEKKFQEPLQNIVDSQTILLKETYSYFSEAYDNFMKHFEKK